MQHFVLRPFELLSPLNSIHQEHASEEAGHCCLSPCLGTRSVTDCSGDLQQWQAGSIQQKSATLWRPLVPQRGYAACLLGIKSSGTFQTSVVFTCSTVATVPLESLAAGFPRCTRSAKPQSLAAFLSFPLFLAGAQRAETPGKTRKTLVSA